MEEFIAFSHRRGILNFWCGYGIETVLIVAENGTGISRTNIRFPVLIILLTERITTFYLTKKIRLKLLISWQAGCAQTTMMFCVMTGTKQQWCFVSWLGPNNNDVLCHDWDQTQDTGRVETFDINFWKTEAVNVKCGIVQLAKISK